MKAKVFTAILLAAGAVMVTIYWLTGIIAIGAIGYIAQSIAFLISFIDIIRSAKKKREADNKDAM